MKVTGVLLVMLLAMTAGCGESSSDNPPQTAPYIEGALTSVGAGMILVEEVPEGNKASLRIPDGTPVWRAMPEGGAQRAQMADLAEGQTVAAWVSGPIAESFPVQATADAVVIRTR